MKQCSFCGETKPLDEFYRDKQKPDGHSPRCKLCKNRDNKEYAARNPEVARASRTRWRKKNPDKMLALVKAWRKKNPEKVAASFKRWATANPKKAQGWRLRNPEAACEAVRRSYQRHRDAVLSRQRERNAEKPEARRAIYRRYYDSHYEQVVAKNERRRAALAGAESTLTRGEWARRLTEFGHCCAYCLKPLPRATKDHFRPIARLGAHSLENVVPACQSCNSRKGDDLVFDWVRRGVGVCQHQSTSSSTGRSSGRSPPCVLETRYSSDSVEA